MMYLLSRTCCTPSMRMSRRSTHSSFTGGRSSGGGSGRFGDQSSPFEITPSGNGVTLEDEMMKVSGNDMDYQAVTTLYTRSMRLLKIAIGRQA